MNPEIIEGQGAAEMLQSNSLFSRTEYDHVKLWMVVAEHVERNNGIFRANPSLGSASRDKKLRTGGNTQPFVNRVAIELPIIDGCRRANQSQTLARNPAMPVAVAIHSRRGYHSIGTSDLAGDQPAADSPSGC